MKVEKVLPISGGLSEFVRERFRTHPVLNGQAGLFETISLDLMGYLGCFWWDCSRLLAKSKVRIMLDLS